MRIAYRGIVHGLAKRWRMSNCLFASRCNLLPPPLNRQYDSLKRLLKLKASYGIVGALQAMPLASAKGIACCRIVS